MKTASFSIQAMREATAPQQTAAPFPPLAQVSKPNLTTDEAAYYLNRSPRTLRIWACKSGKGPIVPKRVHGLLAWNTAEIKAITGVV